MQTRRDFNAGLASLAFGGLALAGCSHVKKLPDYAQRLPDYGTEKMETLPKRRLYPCAQFPDLYLPKGFECRIVSQCGDELSCGGEMPGAADGMGAFAAGPGQVVLVRNHELKRVGGTVTILYDYVNGKVIEQHRSLTKTSRNCSGGATPWGTWLSCEEDLSDGHGHVYEVPALHDGITERLPLKQLGRFNHEAAAVDPVTGAIYMTEDQIDGLFYRFLPDDPAADPIGRGRLQALVFAEGGGTDSRNWNHTDMVKGSPSRRVRWQTLNDPSLPPERDPGLDNPRKWARRKFGAVRFACGEGIYFGRNADGRDEIYFACTSGGRIKSGQIMRYVPDRADIDGGELDLFLESTDEHVTNYSDNLTIAPNGDLIMCEDPYVGGERVYLWRGLSKAAPAYVRGVTPEGLVYDIARLDNGSEFAGACFSTKGETLFLNIYKPATTLAITGNWGTPLPGWSIPSAQSLPRRRQLPG